MPYKRRYNISEAREIRFTVVLEDLDSKIVGVARNDDQNDKILAIGPHTSGDPAAQNPLSAPSRSSSITSACYYCSLPNWPARSRWLSSHFWPIHQHPETKTHFQMHDIFSQHTYIDTSHHPSIYTYMRTYISYYTYIYNQHSTLYINQQQKKKHL